MSKQSFTPGPWKAHEYGSPRGYYFVKSETTNERIVGGPSLDSEANARLIAAAPDLLEALQKTAAALNTARMVMDKASRAYVGELLDAAGAAIAKAVQS